MKYKIFAVSTLSVILSACQQAPANGFSGSTKNEIDQSKICVVSNTNFDSEIKKCQANELVFFAPNQWGNAQLPLNMIAAYCNTNYQIIHNASGVICVFLPERKVSNLDKTNSASAPAK